MLIRPAVAARDEGDWLEPGKTVERELAGDESHSYLIALAAGQYLQATVMQREIDLTAALFGPDGGRVAQFDSRWYGPEPIYFVADSTGNYRLVIQSFQRSAARGAYQLGVEAIRAPTPQDRARIVALDALKEAKRLIEQSDAQSIKLAREKYEAALPLWRAIGDRFAEAQTLNGLGFVSHVLAGPAKALEYFEQALAIRRQIKDGAGEGETLNNIAATHSSLGKKELALEYYNRALPLRRADGYRAGIAQTLANMGLMYYSLGHTQKAIEYLNQALPLCRSSGNRVSEASALINLGMIHKTLGENQQALDHFNRAAQIAREVSDRRGEAYALNHLSRIYIELGEYEKALDLCGRALSLFQFVGDRIGEAAALNNHGAINAFRGDREKALDFYGQALSRFQALGDRYNEASVLLNLGRLNDESGDKRKALEHYNRAIALSRDFKNPRVEALALNHLGLLYASSGESRKALDCYHQALLLMRDLGDRSGEAAALANLARVERDLGDLDEARRQIEAALAILETQRVKFASRQLRDSYFGATRKYHEFYIDLLMRLHRLRPSEGSDVAAFGASERARARGLLEMLAEARADINEGIDASLVDRERALQKKISAAAEYQYRLLGERHTREQMETVKRELDSLIDQSQEVEAEIRKTSPRYAELKYPQPSGLPEIQRLLDPQTMLLEYSLGEERSYLWAVTTTKIESFELPKRAEIEALARKSYEWLSTGETGAQLRARLAGATAKPPECATDLSRILLGPVASQLGRKRLVIVADGALQYLPFAALPAPETERQADGQTRRRSGRAIDRETRSRSLGPSPRRHAAFTPLIVAHEIVNLPSASSLAALRREIAGRAPAPKLVAVIADPVFDETDERLRKRLGKVATHEVEHAALSDAEREVFRSALEVGATDERRPFQRLIFSRREAEEITRLAGPRASFEALDFKASRATALGSNLSQYRIVHFATHGLLNSQHPELSGVALSLFDEQGHPQDGFLRLRDIYNLRLAADLVTLSACKTGLGKEIKGEGLIGLTRGFFYAGAPRVVASLWKVDDRATAELMKLFYRRMLRDGLAPAAALRSAQKGMMSQPRWAAPYYWAGFTLQGEWRR